MPRPTGGLFSSSRCRSDYSERTRAYTTLRDLSERRPAKIDWLGNHNLPAIGGGAGYLLFDIAALWATVQAFHGRAPAGSLGMAYLIGQLGGEIPVPGGIGVVGGGLIGALTVYALPISVATASTLAYRAIAPAIPILFGGLAMISLTRTLRLARTRGESAERT